MATQLKRVTIVSRRITTPDGKVLQNGGEVIRTVRILAEMWVQKGTHAYTKKSKFKHASERIVLSGK